jgi:hypothetical protein
MRHGWWVLTTARHAFDRLVAFCAFGVRGETVCLGWNLGERGGVCVSVCVQQDAAGTWGLAGGSGQQQGMRPAGVSVCGCGVRCALHSSRHNSIVTGQWALHNSEAPQCRGGLLLAEPSTLGPT